jgi:hypothetical protein
MSIGAKKYGFQSSVGALRTPSRRLKFVAEGLMLPPPNDFDSQTPLAAKGLQRDQRHAPELGRPH